MTTNFNITPYYDDFDDTKNFHRILFRPGYAVQARELTQLQTEIQDQIGKFGKHIFTEGTIVAGGGRTFENEVTSIKIQTTYLGNTVNPAYFQDKVIVGADSETKAVVKLAVAETPTDPITLIVKIISGDAFDVSEVISTEEVVPYSANIASSNAFAPGMVFSIDTGIFFVKNCFVYLEPQVIALNKYENTTSHKIGFLVSETIITANDDESLLDNALGTTNYTAPGADRYSIILTLTSFELDAVTDDNFIEIARVVDGNLVYNADRTIYSEIGKELARRTFDESGDYTVKRWPIQILDHVPASGATGPDSTKFTVALDPGKGYIKGYEFETINQTFLTVDRARDYGSASEIDQDVMYGNYIYVNDLFGEFITNTKGATTPYSEVTLYNMCVADMANQTDITTALIGTAQVRFIKFVSGIAPGTSPNVVYKMYLFNIQMNSGKYFKDVEAVLINTNAGSGSAVEQIHANVDSLSMVNGTGDTYLSGQDQSALVWNLPNQHIKTLAPDGQFNNDYYFQRTYTNVDISEGVATIDISSDTDLTFFPNVGSYADDQIYEYTHVVLTDNTSVTSPGNTVSGILDYGTTGASVTTTNNATLVTFDYNDSTLYGKATIIVTIKANNQQQKTKTLSDYTAVVIGGATGAAIPGSPNTTLYEKDTLNASDIYELKAVYHVGASGATGYTNITGVTVNPTTGDVTSWGTGATGVNVTANYTLDNGQRADIYDHGNIILTSPLTIGQYDHLIAVYKNFSHGSSTNVGYLSVDSYTDIAYEDIPSFTDPASGKTYQLRDCVDFRPRRADSGSNIINGQVPYPDLPFEIDYEYYLGRFDKIIATADKSFVVKRGIPDLKPLVPVDESNGMTLYVLGVPPYTGNVNDVQIKYIDNKRYTMRDIGRLEKRISTLEYYTQLTLLEKQAKDTSIQGSNGLDKFKNGFAVDAFTSQDIFGENGQWSKRRWGWWDAWFNGSNTWSQAENSYNSNALGMVENPDFQAAIDPLNQELRATFDSNFHEFAINTDYLDDTERHGDLVTLAFTEKPAISQKQATTYMNVNPFNVIYFFGSIMLEKAFDLWVDVVNLPAVNHVIDVKLPDAEDQTVINRTGSGLIFTTTSSTTTINTNVVSQTTTDLGTKVVDIQYIPFIRANTIFGYGKGFKPKARLYAFIENTPVSQYARPLTKVVVQNHVGTLFDAEQGVYEDLIVVNSHLNLTPLGAGKTVIYTQPLTTNATQRVVYLDSTSGTFTVGKYLYGKKGNGYAQIVSVTTAALGDPLIPDEYGHIAFELQIPPATFRTGERTVRLINDVNNNTETADSIGEAKYTAIGQLQKKQDEILTTRAVQNQRVTVQNRTYYDPVAQTFLVDSLAYPVGFHVSSVDLYFQSKSETIPISLQIRRTVNGYPESVNTIPFSEVILQPQDVNVSANASAKTTFKFATPLHLVPGEYAIVVLSNSQDYNIYVAEVGKTIVDSTIAVSQQPYAGSLFKSQNASTWEPDQNKDLTFVINRADFVSDGTVQFDVADPVNYINYQTLYANSSTILPTGTTIKWDAKFYNNGTFGASWEPLNINQTLDYNILRALDLAANTSDEATLKLRATLHTDNTAVSPGVDVAALSAITALNIINNDASGEAGVKSGGTALARYLTKPINLADGFDATNLNVTININKPIGTNVKVYYKTLPTEATTPISDQLWVEMVSETPLLNSTGYNDFTEYKFFPVGAFDQYGIPQDSPITQRFNAFQIKVVLLSNNEVNTPRLKEFRAIALDA